MVGTVACRVLCCHPGPGWAGLGSTWATLLVAANEKRGGKRWLQPWGPRQWCPCATGPLGQHAVPLGHPRKD